ncbi:MAG: hypothetical protein ACI39W_11045 [Brotaphodocola sp.]
MKKKLFGLGVLTAALTLATGITAFAGSWQQDGNGWYYLRDDGYWQGCGWFTDPEDNSIYYLDPDGYMMSATTVEGYKLGDDGRRIEKTEEDIRREQERKERIAKKASPAKEQAAAELAGDAAKNAAAAVSTTRLAYQSEMKTFMDKYYIEALKTMTELDSKSVVRNVLQDNLETTYKFQAEFGPVAEASLWKMSNPSNASYKPEALIMSYDRNHLTEAAEIETFDTLNKNMIIAALGETEGQAVLDAYNAEIAAGTSSFDREGTTDVGNSYTLKYRNGKVTISVICSEYVAPAEGEEEAAEASSDAATVTEEASTSKVLVAGQAQTVETEAETTVEETSDEAEETEASEEVVDNAAEETVEE